jgi:tetratricopeptide (TPR) repeat protein
MAVAVPLVIALLITVYYVASYIWGIDLYGRGMREMEAGRYDAAIALFDAASRKNLGVAKMSLVYANRGRAYLEKDLADQAIRDFSESIRLNAKPVQTFWNRALAYHRKGEFEQALNDYGVVLARDPNQAGAYHKRAEIFADRGEWDKAIANYSEAIRSAPGNAQFHVDRGMAFAANNELDSAIANFDSAITFNRTHAGAYIQRAGAYGRKGNWTKGLDDVSEAIRQLPEARQLRYARAYIYLDRGIVEEAIADCDEALRFAPDYDLGFLTRARAEALQKDWNKVFRDTAHALELNSSLPLAHYLRGRAFTAKGEFDQAISEYNDALRLDPGFRWALIERAFNYGYRREFSRALAELRKTVERFPGADGPHLGLAWFLATCPEPSYRDGAEAIVEALQACEISYWSNWSAIEILGAAYAEAGDFDRALEFVNLALRMRSSSPYDTALLERRLSAYHARTAIRDAGMSGSGRNPFEEGVSACARGDYDRALSYFNSLLPPNSGGSISATLFPFLHPGLDNASGVPWAASERLPLANAFYYRGLAYQKKQEWDRAIADFTKALELEPQSTLALSDRGETYNMKDEPKRGLRDFDEIIRLKPKDANAYMLRADALRLMKQWDAALDAATTAIQLDPGSAFAYHVRGQAYLGKKEYAKAARDFSESDRLDPNHPENMRARAETFSAQGDYTSALRELRSMVERFPRSAEAHNSLAWFLATCPDATYRNGAEAVVYAESACDLSEWKKLAEIDTLAAAYAQAGDFNQAIKYVTQALSMMGPTNPNREEIQEHLALFQRKEAYHAKPPE